MTLKYLSIIIPFILVGCRSTRQFPAPLAPGDTIGAVPACLNESEVSENVDSRDSLKIVSVQVFSDNPDDGSGYLQKQDLVNDIVNGLVTPDREEFARIFGKPEYSINVKLVGRFLSEKREIFPEFYFWVMKYARPVALRRGANSITFEERCDDYWRWPRFHLDTMNAKESYQLKCNRAAGWLRVGGSFGEIRLQPN